MSSGLQLPDLPGLAPVAHLGSGGYADVYLYDQQTPRRRVAVKVLRDQQLSAGRHVERFMSEANAMAELAHPHIVPVYSTGVAPDGRPYIVMMYYPPPSLAERAAAKPFEVSDVLRIGIQIGSAVETAHRAGILHRDIKPANILVSQYGQPGLTDFGIAAQIADADDDDQGLSLPWSPPEVIFATSPARPSSDTYSLAATLWHLLVGRSPFESPGVKGSAYELMTRIRDLPAPSTGLPIPPSLDRLLRQTLAKDPDQRPRRAMDFVMALQAIEQELRLPRTEALVEDERVVPPVPRERSHPTVDATRHKSPISVAPAPAPTPAPTRAPVPRSSMSPSPAADATVQRGVVSPVPNAQISRSSPGLINAAPAGPTIQRPVVAPGEAAQLPVEPESRSRHGIAALAGGLLVVALIVGLVLSRQGRGEATAPKATTPAASAHIGGPADALPPGPVTVKGTRKDQTITFTWTYSAALTSDTFQWRTQDGASSGAAKTATVDIPAPGPVCLQVKVVRADGTNAAPDWSAPGCVP